MRPLLYKNIKEVRLLDEAGKTLGVLPFLEAQNIARDRGFDLIVVSERATPPVAKLGDLGKYLYEKEKKERAIRAKHKPKELKELQISFREGKHDMERKAKQVGEFLKEGHQVQVRLMMRGREKYNKDFAKKKFDEFLAYIAEPFREDSRKVLPSMIIAVLTKRS